MATKTLPALSTLVKPVHVSQRAWDNCQPGEKRILASRAAETPEQTLARKKATIRKVCEVTGGNFAEEWAYFCKVAGIPNDEK